MVNFSCLVLLDIGDKSLSKELIYLRYSISLRALMMCTNLDILYASGSPFREGGGRERMRERDQRLKITEATAPQWVNP